MKISETSESMINQLVIAANAYGNHSGVMELGGIEAAVRPLVARIARLERDAAAFRKLKRDQKRSLSKLGNTRRDSKQWP